MQNKTIECSDCHCQFIGKKQGENCHCCDGVHTYELPVDSKQWFKENVKTRKKWKSSKS